MVRITQKILRTGLDRRPLRDCGPRLAVRSAAQAGRRITYLFTLRLKSGFCGCARACRRGTNIEQRIRTVDGERAKYLQEYFGKSWCNPHLYDLMISSCEDEDATARVIVYGMGKVEMAASV